MPQLFKVSAVGEIKIDPPESHPIHIRGRRGPGESVSKTSAICACCGDKILAGEQYFFINFPVCLGCCKYE